MNSKNLDIIEIDTLGLKCPMPLLMLKKAIYMHPSASKFRILANDPLANIDIHVFCNDQKYTIVQSKTQSNVLSIIIETH